MWYEDSVKGEIPDDNQSIVLSLSNGQLGRGQVWRTRMNSFSTIPHGVTWIARGRRMILSRLLKTLWRACTIVES